MLVVEGAIQRPRMTFKPLIKIDKNPLIGMTK